MALLNKCRNVATPHCKAVFTCRHNWNAYLTRGGWGGVHKTDMLGAAAAVGVTLHTFLINSQQPRDVDSFISVRREFIRTLGAALAHLPVPEAVRKPLSGLVGSPQQMDFLTSVERRGELLPVPVRRRSV